MAPRNLLDRLQRIQEWEIITHIQAEHLPLTVRTHNDLQDIQEQEQEQVIHSSRIISHRTTRTCSTEEEWPQGEWEWEWEEDMAEDTAEIHTEEWEWEEWAEWEWEEWEWEWAE